MSSTICVKKYTCGFLFFGLTLLIFSVHETVSLAQTLTDPRVESHPGLGVESMYSEAVIAYNKKRTGEALQILDNLLKTAPNHVEGLELMALTLKSQGNDKKAIEVYSKLIKLKPPKERGPYHFELGVIYNRDKKSDLARPNFQQAIGLHFNEVISHLFLGLIEFNAGNMNDAQPHFDEVKSDGTPDLKVVARYYLGLIHFKNGYGAGGTYELTEARSIAEDIPENKTAADIKKSADQILAPFNASQWFGNLIFLGQYDSNISLLPSGTASAQASNKSTPNLVFNGGAGRMSSPLRTIQWVGSYRFSYNKTLNSNTKSYEFFTNTPAIYLNYRPLAQTTGGLKLEGTFSFQNTPSDSSQSSSSQSYTMMKYSFGGEIGPFIRHQLNRDLQMQLDTSLKSQTNYADSGLTGNTLNARLTAKGSSTSQYLNPGGSLNYESYRARNLDLRYNALGIGVNNSMKLSGTHTLTLSLDYLSTRYPENSTSRSDSNFTSRLSLVHTLNPKWSLLSDVSYITNSSNVPDSYSYNRFLCSLGAGWSL